MSKFAGMTKEACPAACNAEGCVITGKGFCAHPTKGGIPASFKNDPAIQEAFAAACKALGVPNVHLTPHRLTP
jgi:hypothetical protein